MRLLLDTYAMYWYIEGDPQLSAVAQTLIQDAANEIPISPASYWEIAIKVSIGKWILNRPPDVGSLPGFHDRKGSCWDFIVLVEERSPAVIPALQEVAELVIVLPVRHGE